MYNSWFRSFFRLTLYVSWVFLSLGIQALSVLLRSRFQYTFPLICHRTCCRIMGAKVIVRGRPSKEGSVIFVSNHCSYADISFIGGLVRGSFVAKAEMRNWPVFGWCARLSRCVFVDRRPRFAKEQAEEMKQRLIKGERLILFPEGTSSDGNRVLRFRSSLLQAAETRVDGRPVYVQPMSIAYTHLDGIPIGRHLRPFFAWYGDMDMASHLWELMGMGKLTVCISFDEPVTLDQFASRKDLTTYCEAVVSARVSEALTGHEQPILYTPERTDTVPPPALSTAPRVVAEPVPA